MNNSMAISIGLDGGAHLINNISNVPGAAAAPAASFFAVAISVIASALEPRELTNFMKVADSTIANFCFELAGERIK